MTERTILERLDAECNFSVHARSHYFVIKNKFDNSQFEVLTRAELIQLADEIRELAGEDFDHG